MGAADRRLHDFHGGIHPPERKERSLSGPIQRAPLPALLCIPLSQHIGAAASPCVTPGERVLGGQCIALADGFVSVPCHAPTSATV
jgi:electron transport complex protein RnfC